MITNITDSKYGMALIGGVEIMCRSIYLMRKAGHITIPKTSISEMPKALTLFGCEFAVESATDFRGEDGERLVMITLTEKH